LNPHDAGTDQNVYGVRRPAHFRRCPAAASATAFMGDPTMPQSWKTEARLRELEGA
jgi:hypothetical protein